jgi:hypothetical protein
VRRDYCEFCSEALGERNCDTCGAALCDVCEVDWRSSIDRCFDCKQEAEVSS